jgi:hypothetical protein
VSTPLDRAIADVKAVHEAREAERQEDERQRVGWLVVSDATGAILATIPRASWLRVSVWHADGTLDEVWKGRDR